MADEERPQSGDDQELVLEDKDKLDNQDGDEIASDEQPNEAVVALATDMGWRPKEEFKGDPEAWKPADQFIRAGHEIQRSTARDLKALRQTVDTMQRTSTTLLEQQLEEQRTKLAAEYEAAVADDDPKTAAEKLRSLDKLDTEKPTRPTLSSEAQAFQDRHSSWLGKDVLATDRAVEICNKLAAAGKSPAEQLEEAEKAIKRERPDLFAAPVKRQAATHDSRRDAGSTKAKKSFADLPAEAQTVALDMEDRLSIPRETYAANFFNQQPAQRRA